MFTGSHLSSYTFSLARVTSTYVCQSCGAQTRQFFGRCASCGSWNSLVEQAAGAADTRRRRPVACPGEAAMPATPRRSEPIQAVGERPLQRLASGYGELDRVLGGGLVPGSLVLLGGEPGVGKSTLLTMALAAIAQRTSALLVTGEESAAQVRLRAERIGGAGAIRVVAETDLDGVVATIAKERPAVCVVDSVQTLWTADLASAPGSVAQVREAAGALLQIGRAHV